MTRSLIPLRRFAADTGDSVSTVRRRVRERRPGYPQPVNVDNRWMFYSDERDAYIDSRPRITEKPTVKANDKSVEAR